MTMTINELILQDAAEVRGMVLGERGARKGLLIARSVHLDSHGGRPKTDASATVSDGKVTAREFERLVAGDTKIAGWSHDTITRHVRTWDKFAAKAGLPTAAELTPGQEIDLPTDAESIWSSVYDSTDGDARYKGIKNGEAIRKEAEAAGVGASKALDIAKNTAAMQAAIKASPEVAKAASAAVREHANRRIDKKLGRTREQQKQREQNRPTPEKGYEQYLYLVGIFQEVEAKLRAADKRLEKEGVVMSDGYREVVFSTADDARMRLDLLLIKLGAEISTSNL